MENNDYRSQQIQIMHERQHKIMLSQEFALRRIDALDRKISRLLRDPVPFFANDYEKLTSNSEIKTDSRMIHEILFDLSQIKFELVRGIDER